MLATTAYGQGSAGGYGSAGGTHSGGSSGYSAASNGGHASLAAFRQRIQDRRNDRQSRRQSGSCSGGYGSSGGTAAGRESAGPSSQPRTDQPAAPPTAPVEKGASLSVPETELVNALNDYRRAHGLAEFRVDPILQRLARRRVTRIDVRYANDHYGTQPFNHHAFGQWPDEAAKSAGFNGDATEDLTMGAPTATECVDGWDRSYGHKQAMLGKVSINDRWVDKKFNLVGVARQGDNYIAMFGRRDDGDVCTCKSGGPCRCGDKCACAEPAK